jgi:RNA polymerase sigma factor (sigma-70 family)
MGGAGANAENELRRLLEMLRDASPGERRARVRNDLARAMSTVARAFAESRARNVRHTLDWEGIAQDVVIDVLDAWERNADIPSRPCAYLRVAVQNRIASHARRPSSSLRAAQDGENPPSADGPAMVNTALAARLDAPDAALEARERLARIVASTPPRDLAIVLAIAAGEETREEVAARYAVSRAAIDQIVSRFRRRLSESADTERVP